MWIHIEAPHKKLVDAEKLDTVYIQYKAGGRWAVIGTIGDRDIHLVTVSTEREAVDWISTMLGM